MQKGHYFDDDPDTKSKPTLVEINLPDLALQLTADRGVFSSQHLDAGTKFLLLEAPPLGPDDRRILDVGCGWGPIAVVAARRAPDAHVWAIDVNERARNLTTQNAAALGLANRITVGTPDAIDAAQQFDRILSNPPIRIGKAALHDLLDRWLARLTPTGVAHLVVQRHLGSDSLADWLEGQGHGVHRLKSRAGFRILEVGSRTEPNPSQEGDQ